MSVRSGITLLGAAIGASFGAPQLGFLLGSLVGNAVDPQKIQGPQIGDGAVQTSRAGVPINLVYGGPIPCIGTLVERGPRTIIEVEEQQGKGGGPVTVTERALQTFAILIGVNALDPDGGFAGVSWVKADGKLIYGAESSPPIAADYPSIAAYTAALLDFQKAQVAGSKLLQKTRFYLGTSTQMPDPALEAIDGVGTTPAYRKRAYMVAEQWDITDYGNRIPQFEFGMVGSGSASTAKKLDALQFGGQPYPWANGATGLTDPRRAGVKYGYALIENSASFYPDSVGVVYYDSLEAALEAAMGVVIYPPAYTGGTLMGWTFAMSGDAYNEGGVPSATLMAPWDSGMADPNDKAELGLVISRRSFGASAESLTSPEGSGPAFSPPVPIWLRRLHTLIYPYDMSPPYAGGDFPSGVLEYDGGYPYVPGYSDYCNNGTYIRFGDIVVICRAIPDCGAGGENLLPIPDADGFFFDRSTREIISPDGSCQIASGSFKMLQPYSGSRVFAHQPISILAQPVGPALAVGDPLDTEAFWTSAYADAVGLGYMAAGLAYPSDYPKATASACECSPAIPAISGSGVLLSEVQADLCRRAGIDASRIDVTDLIDIVNGYKLSRSTTAGAATQILQGAYAYDAGEWDSKLRFIKRGGPVQFTIEEEDLLAGEEAMQEIEREQAYSVPRKFTVIAYSLEARSTPVPQTAERYSPDVRSVGDPVVASLPLVLSADETKRIADRTKKVALANADGGVKLRTWMKFFYACATDIFAFQGLRYRIDRINILDGVIELEEARRDRQSAYTSILTGVPVEPPSSSPGSIAGPTLFVAANLPYLRDEDNISGLYLFARGVFSGWQGCIVQMRKPGEANFRDVLTISVPNTIGYLTAPMDDPADSPSSNEVELDTFGVLSSATVGDLAAGVNAAAIISAGDAPEIIQFATATQIDDDSYLLPDAGVSRALMGTTAAAHATGERFVLLTQLNFLPLSEDLIGQLIEFRPVSIGTAAESNAIYSIIYDPAAIVWDGGAP